MTPDAWDEEYTERVAFGTVSRRLLAGEILALRGKALSLRVARRVYGFGRLPGRFEGPLRVVTGSPGLVWTVEHDRWDLWSSSDPETARYHVHGGPHQRAVVACAALNDAIMYGGKLGVRVHLFSDPCTGGWVMSFPGVSWLPSTLEGDLAEAVSRAALIVAELL